MRLRQSILVLTITLSLSYGEDEFRIVESYPAENDDLILKKGVSITLSCTASEKFNRCGWARPSSQSPCGLFSQDEQKRCSRSGDQSAWTVTISEDKLTCSAHVEDVREYEQGEWSCELGGYPDKHGKYATDIKHTSIVLMTPSVVEIEGPAEITVTEDSTTTFTCQASGKPLPQAGFEWTLSRIALSDYSVLDSNEGDAIVAETISVHVDNSWSGKTLACITTQTDSEGNTLEMSDSRNIRVVESKTIESNENWNRGGDFYISQRYPPGVADEQVEFLVAENVKMTYSCESTLPWNVCQWKRPNTITPCGLFSDSSGKSCTGAWGADSGNEWKVRKTSTNKCILEGTTSLLDEGEWNCELQSKPIMNEHNVYESDQKYFEVIVIKPARMQLDLPQELELTEGDDYEISLSIQDANPIPDILYYLNSQQIKPEIVDKSSPQPNSQGLYSFTQTVVYHAHPDDSGKKLIIVVRQTDAEDNVIEETAESFLTVRAAETKAQKQGMSAGIIAAIVTVGAFILLAIILICVAAKTGKACFKRKPEPEKVVYDYGVGTDPIGTSTTAAEAQFGPDKPARHQVGLLGDSDMTQPFIYDDPDKLKRFAKDETKAFHDEGIGSQAGSLPSLDTAVTDRDWKDTVTVLGPKFAHFANFVRGEVSDDDEEQAEKKDLV